MTIERLGNILKNHGIIFDIQNDKIIAHDGWDVGTKQNIDSILTINNNELYVNGKISTVKNYLGY